MGATINALFGVSFILLVAAVGCGETASEGTGGAGDTSETAIQTPEGQGVVSTPQPEAATGGVEHTVELSHTYFTPAMITIGVGDIVIFRNLEAMSHPLSNQELGLDTGPFPQGERTFTFDKPGMYTIINTAHGSAMTIQVQ